MVRKLSAVVALAMLVFTASPAAGGAGTGVFTAGDDGAATSFAVENLTAGGVYEGIGYELAATGMLVEPSFVTSGVSEVRVSVALRNTAGFSFPAFVVPP